MQEQIDQGDGSSSDQGLNSLDENLVLYYLKQQYETPNKFDIDSSLLGTSQVHREFSIFAFLCRLASKMLTVKIQKQSLQMFLTNDPRGSEHRRCYCYSALARDSIRSLTQICFRVA